MEVIVSALLYNPDWTSNRSLSGIMPEKFEPV